MDQMFEYIFYIIQRYGVQMLVMIILVEIILFLIKKPIKLLTKKIRNERLRKLANKIFIVFAFVFAFIFQILGNLWLSKWFNIGNLGFITCGSFSVVLYALGEGIIVKSSPSQIAESAEKITKEVENIAVNKITTKKDVQCAIDAFNDLCDKATSGK